MLTFFFVRHVLHEGFDTLLVPRVVREPVQKDEHPPTTQNPRVPITDINVVIEREVSLNLSSEQSPTRDRFLYFWSRS